MPSEKYLVSFITHLISTSIHEEVGIGMKKKIRTQAFALLVIMFIFAIPLQAQATEYYVDQNHPSANDQNSGIMDRPWKTITKANQTLTAGDTVYIKVGTYSSYINPTNSGAATHQIIYRNYGTDVVTISGAEYAIYLNGKDYITVNGIKASSCSHFFYLINGANHNVISYCVFDGQSPPDWSSSLIQGSSQYNWVHHCTFSNAGECSSGGDDVGSVLDVGNEESSTDQSWHNLFENCTFFHGGHHVLGLETGYCTVRNNYFYNDDWSRSKGNRTLYMTGYTSVTGNNVIEGNRFGYAAPPCDDVVVSNVSLCTQYNIVRYNNFYHNNAAALQTYGYSGYSNGSYNKLYNNTFFNSGYNIYT
jgi:hypothetical protein